MSISALQLLAMSPHHTEKKNKGAKISKAPKTPTWSTKKTSTKEAYTSVQGTAATAKKKHSKAESTTNGYEGHVHRGMEWLASFALQSPIFGYLWGTSIPWFKVPRGYPFWGGKWAILHHAPLIPAGMNPFHWNPPESAGMTQESTGMDWNPQEWNRNGQEWHWNGQKWTFWS